MMILSYEEQLLALIDERIEQASEDELFAGGYLRGHISLAAAECEEQGIEDVKVWQAKVDQSLEAARTELSPLDRLLVAEFWQELRQAAAL